MPKSKKELLDQAKKAAQAYITRTGYILSDEIQEPDAFLALESGLRVYVLIGVTTDSEEIAVSKKRQKAVDKERFDRVDIIKIRVIADDRALLRHTKDIFED